MALKTVVCLPTYNEAGNIRHAVEAVLKVLKQALILVIDDNSPDGTGRIADQLANKDPRVFVLHRPYKQGLGKAYCHGFRFAIDQMNADLIIQMDADLSHPPEKIPEMILAAQKAELVIGSRYVSGGYTKNWNMLRQMISRFGASYARNILRFPIYDPTAGFKLWRRQLLDLILKLPVSASGYVFQVETSFYAHLMGAKIIEIPICFTERGLGQSKMTLSITFEAFWRVPLIRMRKSRLLPTNFNERARAE